MKLIDTNIILYSYLPEYQYLKDIFIKKGVFVSEITRVEVLGYHKLTKVEEDYFQDIFDIVPVIFPTHQIFDEAIIIRRKYNLKLGDSIIAATAWVNNFEVCTRNLKDFERVSGLNCFNPVI